MGKEREERSRERERGDRGGKAATRLVLTVLYSSIIIIFLIVNKSFLT